MPSRFSLLLAQHLSASELKQNELASRTGFSEAQVSGWLSGRDHRLSRAVIGHIAHVLATAYAHAPRGTDGERPQQKRRGRPSPRVAAEHAKMGMPYHGPRDLYSILSELLAAAGYDFQREDSGVAWERIAGSPASRRLKVGWYDKRPLAYGNATKPEGIARTVTDRIASLLAAQLDWIPIELEKIVPKLLTGEIDLLCCEYIGVESIACELWLSDPLPFVRVAPIGIVRAESVKHTVVETSGRGGGTARAKRLRREMLAFTHTQTLIGQSLYASLIPESVLDTGENAIGATAVSGDLHQCYSEALDDAGSPERIKCFVSDTLTYLDAKRDFGKQAGRLPAMSNTPMPSFGLCFALHPREGGRLGRLLNMGIEKLKEMNFFQRVAYAPYADVLHQNHALLREICPELATRIERDDAMHAPMVQHGVNPPVGGE